MANKFDYSGDGTLGRLLTRLKSTLAGYAKQSAVDQLSEAITDLERAKISKTGITLGLHSDGKYYIFVDGAPVGAGFELSGNNGDVFGYVDDNNNIVLNGSLSDGSYSIKYETEDGKTINIGDLVLDSNVYYSITNTLTNCTNSNSATQVIGGQAYTATITPNSGYELKSVTVTMGGNAVSVSGGNINIANVTGNIVITAAAEVSKPAYNNLVPAAINLDGAIMDDNGTKCGYKRGYRWSSSNTLKEGASYTSIGLMPLPTTQSITVYVYGLDFTATTGDVIFACTAISNGAVSNNGNFSNLLKAGFTGAGWADEVEKLADNYWKITTTAAASSAKWFAISGTTVSGMTPVVSINEPIL